MLNAARTEFASIGYHGASMRVIAEKAGLSTRTLYNYYPDKSALFEACIEMSSIEIDHQILIEGSDLHSRLLSFATQMQVQMAHEENLQITRLIFRESMSLPELIAIARIQFYRYQVEPVRRILEEGGIPFDRSESLAAIYVGMTYTRWQQCVIFNDPPMTRAEIENYSKQITDLFLRGAIKSNCEIAT
ncbi:MAG TPA: TetR/AcrR family transcriptional regulator [Sphingobium sp.]|uniref:TetR/AcrR family transcriptional regulator n=1 Tax=Sphingobium sp. TaxID=1912891 RepID=UPI002ED3D2BC